MGAASESPKCRQGCRRSQGKATSLATSQAAQVRGLKNSATVNGSVPVMLGLVGAFGRDTEVVGLLLGQLGEFHSDLLQMQAGDFFVEFFWQTIHVRFVELPVRPEIE